MAYSTVLKATGEITLPPEVREQLGAKAGDVLELTTEGTCAILRLAARPRNRFESYIGALPQEPDAESSNEWLRGLRDDDPQG